MRILYLGAFQEEWSTESYLASALERAGCEVVRLEESVATHEAIVKAAAEHKPEWFVFAKARFCDAEHNWPEETQPICQLIQALRPHVGRVICWLFDLMAGEFDAERFQWASTIAAACDLFVTTDGNTAPQLPNALVIRQGVPDDVDRDCDWKLEPRADVLFLGTAYRDRQLLVDALTQRFGERFQHVNDCRGKELTRLVRSARICVGPHYPRLANYWSNRLYVITGHGGLFAAGPVVGMEAEGWRSGENFLALPSEPEQMAAKLEEYVTRHDAGQLETIRRRGYEFAHAHCTYDDRVRELLAAIAQQPAFAQQPKAPLDQEKPTPQLAPETAGERQILC